MGKTSCFLVLFATQVLDVSPAPTKLSTDLLPEDHDYSQTYLQFFKIKDLIEKINIKKFREFQESRANGIEGPVEAEVKDESSVASSEDNLPQIDLTEEAINNDEVNGKVPALDTYQAANEETTTAPTVAPTAVPSEAPATAKAVEDEGGLPQPSEEDALLNEIDTGADKFFISKESVESAKKYGYKILLKKVNGKEVPVGKIKFTFPTLVEITPEEDDVIVEEVTSETVVEDKVEEKIAPENESLALEEGTATTTPVQPVEYVASEDAASEVDNSEETTTAAEEILAETTTALSVTFLPPPIMSVISTVEVLDENEITEGVKQITEDTEVAIEEIKNQNTTDTIVFAECTAQFADVEEMLMSLAKIVSKQTPMISEILSVGKSLKDESSPEILSRSGAKLLKLLEPFLESLVPAELTGCAGESSNAMLLSLSGMASQLDTIANNEINPDKATSLHKSATSLQLAAWVMAQLQSSVHTIYSQEGICGDKDSSTAEILGSLSKAITGYIPIVTMLGNQESVEELNETIEALNKAQADIEQLESKSGTSLPGVECGASFSEMAEALENLADFIKALDTNGV